MRILLLGANGQLGSRLADSVVLASLGDVLLATRGGDTVHGGASLAADLDKPESLRRLLDHVKPDIVINAAAYTAVDHAEQEEAVATRINGEAVGVLGGWAAEHGCLVVHYSTDYVFDGSQREPYAVDARAAPLNAYGRSKLAGEQALQDSGAAYLIFRTSWVYAAHGRNFLRTMLRLAENQHAIRVVADQYGAPTSTGQIERCTVRCLQQWIAADAAERMSLQGTYHLAAQGVASWHQFAVNIFEHARHMGIIEQQPSVVAISSSDFPAAARRPTYSLLDTRKLRETFDVTLTPWNDELPDVMRELGSNRHKSS